MFHVIPALYFFGALNAISPASVPSKLQKPLQSVTSVCQVKQKAPAKDASRVVRQKVSAPCSPLV